MKQSIQKPAVLRKIGKAMNHMLFVIIKSTGNLLNGKSFSYRLAKTIRVLSVPPVMVTALIWAVSNPVSPQMLLLCLTYFFSVVLLTLRNKALHVHASGHACSVTGPLLLLIYLVDWTLIFPCIASGLFIAWSSLYLKRHTAKEPLSFAAALLCV